VRPLQNSVLAYSVLTLSTASLGSRGGEQEMKHGTERDAKPFLVGKGAFITVH
jgi:hypothetical protein